VIPYFCRPSAPRKSAGRPADSSTRLLPQPSGFEGLCSIVVVVDVDDLAVPHLELREEANVRLDPAA
jgi:hypothetical protein